MRFHLSAFRSRDIPAPGLRQIFRDAFTLLVTPGKVVLRESVTLFGGFAKPFHRFRMVFRDALPLKIHHAQIGLRLGVTLLRCLLV